MICLVVALATMTIYHTRLVNPAPTGGGRLPVSCTCGFKPQGKARLIAHFRETARINKKMVTEHQHCRLHECQWCSEW